MYEGLTNEELAERVHRTIGLPLESAMRAVSSSDPDLGRDWAIELLRRSERHAEGQERLTQRVETMRSLAIR